MHVQHVAAGEDALLAGLQAVIDHRALGKRAHLHARLLAELIFGNQAHGQKQRIAVEMLLRAGDRLALLVHLRHRDAAEALTPLNIDHRMTEHERNIIVLEALDDISVEAAGIGHQFHAGQHLGALERHAAGHDEADVAAAEDDHTLAGHIALQVDEFLRRASGEHARAARAGGRQRAAGPLAASHGQHDGPGLKELHALFTAHGGHEAVAVHAEHSGAAAHLYAQLLHAVDIALGVFGTGQLLLEAVQAESVMDALAQNAAHVVFAFQNQQVADARLTRSDGGRHARRARADHQHVHILHLAAKFLAQHIRRPPFVPLRRWCLPAGGFPRRTW